MINRIPLRMNKKPVFRIIFAIWLICGLIPAEVFSSGKKNSFDLLRGRLVGDGFDKKRIDEIFGDPRAELNLEDVSLFFVHSEAKLNYGQFTSERSVAKAQKYMTEHITELKAAEKTYGVDKEIITAILLVETRLGRIVGSSPIFNTLSTMACVSDPGIREDLWRSISDPGKLPRDRFEKKADSKSAWAYKELKAFIEYTETEKFDPLDISGSYAGALGIAQFMPTSILAYAKDGNNDDKIDLFNHSDAIASIANYLKTFGWRPGIERKKAKKVIYYYNRSKYYVNTILKVSDLLRK